MDANQQDKSRQQQVCWEKKEWKFAFVIILIIVFLLWMIILLISIFGFDWTGFNGGFSKVTTTSITHGITTTREQPVPKTLWDYLQSFATIAIPITITAGTIWFSHQQSKTSQQIATDQQQETILKTYIDDISSLILNKNSSLGATERTIARAQTLIALRKLNPKQKGILLQFLYDAQLVGHPYLVDGHKTPLRKRSNGRSRIEAGQEASLFAFFGRPRRFGATKGGGGMGKVSTSRTLQR